jgi:four helix bundle protein
MNNYKELKVWQKSFDLSIEIYMVSKDFPKEEMFGLTSQMRRSAVSIPSNIAEGKGRFSNSDFIRFLLIAQGSCNEIETQILIAEKINYLSKAQSDLLVDKCNEVQKMINALINSLK